MREYKIGQLLIEGCLLRFLLPSANRIANSVFHVYSTLTDARVTHVGMLCMTLCMHICTTRIVAHCFARFDLPNASRSACTACPTLDANQSSCMEGSCSAIRCAAGDKRLEIRQLLIERMLNDVKWHFTMVFNCFRYPVAGGPNTDENLKC